MTLNLDWQIDAQCPVKLTITAPDEAMPKQTFDIGITTDIESDKRYAIYDGNNIVRDWTSTDYNQTFNSYNSGKELTIEAISEKEGCETLRAEKKVKISGNTSLTIPEMMPWIFAGLCGIATIGLIWKKKPD